MWRTYDACGLIGGTNLEQTIVRTVLRRYILELKSNLSKILNNHHCLPSNYYKQPNEFLYTHRCIRPNICDRSLFGVHICMFKISSRTHIIVVYAAFRKKKPALSLIAIVLVCHITSYTRIINYIINQTGRYLW